MSNNDGLNKLLDEDGLRNTIHEIIEKNNSQNCSQTLSDLTGLRDIMSQAYRLKYPQKSFVFEVEDDDYDEKENKCNDYRKDEFQKDTLTYNHYYQVITDKLEELTRKEKSCYIDLLQKRRKTQGGYRKSKKRKTRRKNKAKRGTKKKK